MIDYSAAPDAVRLEGIPGCPAFFPVEDFRKAINQVMQRDGRALLEYGDPKGHAGLRRVLVDRLARVGIETDVDDVVITGGSTQGVAIAARLFCDPGDAVVVEAPTYPGRGHHFLAAGLRLAPVPMGPAGLDLDALDALLARGGVRLVYTMPSFHNPLGVSTSLDHRRRLLEITARHGVPVLEDDFENDLRVSGRAAPPLQGARSHGPRRLRQHLLEGAVPGRAGRLAGRGPARVRGGDGAEARAGPRVEPGAAGGAGAVLPRRRLRPARQADHARDRTALHRGRGGARTASPEGYDVHPSRRRLRRLGHAARGDRHPGDAARRRARGVVYAPGQIFFPDGRRSSALRFSVAQASVDEIERGVRALGEVVRAELPRGRVARTLREETRIHV